MKVFSVCTISLLLIILPIFSAFAQERKFPTPTAGQINESLAKTVPIRFIPDNPLYILIRSKENVARFFQPSSVRKASFDGVVSGKRLKEVFLLCQKNKYGAASSNLKSYSKRLSKLTLQIDKAKEQNQDVTGLANELGESLKYQEVLLWAISNQIEASTTKEIAKNYDLAVVSFVQTVETINKIKPGLRDRFITVVGRKAVEEENKNTFKTQTSSPSPTPTQIRPKIIY